MQFLHLGLTSDFTFICWNFPKKSLDKSESFRLNASMECVPYLDLQRGNIFTYSIFVHS